LRFVRPVQEARRGSAAKGRKHDYRQGTDHRAQVRSAGIGCRLWRGFIVDEQRRVYVQKAEVEETSDPVIDRFLAFLAQDMAKHPDKSVVPFPQSLLDRAAALTAGMTVDLDAEIEGDVSI